MILKREIKHNSNYVLVLCISVPGFTKNKKGNQSQAVSWRRFNPLIHYLWDLTIKGCRGGGGAEANTSWVRGHVQHTGTNNHSHSRSHLLKTSSWPNPNLHVSRLWEESPRRHRENIQMLHRMTPAKGFELGTFEATVLTTAPSWNAAQSVKRMVTFLILRWERNLPCYYHIIKLDLVLILVQ